MSSRVPTKHARDQPTDFQGFLNDLQDWELSKKDKEKKMKPQASNSKSGISAEDKRSTLKTPIVSGQYDYLRKYNAVNTSSSFMTEEEDLPDATSEKELGNEYYKQKKFKEAIDCYSRSIALSPTAVAYANRAMSYLKLRRFREAEDDCTEALNLDDRYIKAYSRRATARKELGKLKESIEDAEFALRLEPQNQEVKKQYTEAKSLYEKGILQKTSIALENSVQKMQEARKSDTKVNGHGIHSVSSSTQKTAVATGAVQEDNTKIPVPTSLSLKEMGDKSIMYDGRIEGQGVDGSRENVIQNSGTESDKALQESLELQQRTRRPVKQQLNASVQELASRAASRAMAEAAKNITPPNSAYQFEVSWRGLSGDRALQSCMLKATSPSALPQIFKNALSAPLLIDIIKCIATFFTEEMDLAIKFLEYLTKVPRFDILIMCLSSTDQADLVKLWDEVFSNRNEYAEEVENLRAKYCLKR